MKRDDIRGDEHTCLGVYISSTENTNVSYNLQIWVKYRFLDKIYMMHIIAICNVHAPLEQ